jgi:hypothetical protein
MFTAGSILSVFVRLNHYSPLLLLMLAVPIASFWILYLISKKTRTPEAAMHTMTLFKTSVILEIVLRGLAAAAFIFASVYFFIRADAPFRYYNTTMMWYGIICILIACGLATLITFYAVYAFKVVRGVKLNILNNTYEPLPKIGIFTKLVYVSIILTLLTGIITPIIAASLGYNVADMRREIDTSIYWLIDPYLRPWMSVVTNDVYRFLYTIIQSAGAVTIMMVLNKFNKSLTIDADTEM